MAKIGSRSQITRFVRTLLNLLEHGTAKPHLKHLTELFSFLLDFAKLGDQEAEFLLNIQAITVCVEFYLKICGNCSSTNETELEVSDDDDSEDDIIALPMPGTDMAAARTASLDKMVFLQIHLQKINMSRVRMSRMAAKFALKMLTYVRLEMEVAHVMEILVVLYS